MISGKQVSDIFGGLSSWVGKYAGPKIGSMEAGMGKDVLSQISNFSTKTPLHTAGVYGGAAGAVGGVMSSDRDSHFYTGAAQGAFAGVQMAKMGLSKTGVAGAAAGAVWGMMSDDTSIMSGAFMGASIGAGVRHGKAAWNAGGFKSGFSSVFEGVKADLGFAGAAGAAAGGAGRKGASQAASQAASSAGGGGRRAVRGLLPARGQAARGGATAGGATVASNKAVGGRPSQKLLTGRTLMPAPPLAKRNQTAGSRRPAKRINLVGSKAPKRNQAAGSTKPAKRSPPPPAPVKRGNIKGPPPSVRPPNRNQEVGSKKPAKSSQGNLSKKKAKVIKENQEGDGSIFTKEEIEFYSQQQRQSTSPAPFGNPSSSRLLDLLKE